LTKRGSRASIKPTSAIRSTLASSVSPPKLSTNALRFSDHASARMRSLISSARSLQYRTRALSPICAAICASLAQAAQHIRHDEVRSEEHTSELQSRENLVCRLL